MKILPVLLTLALASSAHAQAPPTPPVAANRVLTVLTLKPGVDMAAVQKVMPQEVRETLRLYLDGKIDQWYSQTEARGVIFILNCSTAAEAKAMMDALPLGKNHFADFQFTPLGPLQPLRLLAGPPPAAVAP